MKRRHSRLRTVAVALVFCLAAGKLGHGQLTGGQSTGNQSTGDQSVALAQSKRYAKCMALARSDPDIGHKTAQAWLADGGGIAARHCTAVALLGLGYYADAARMLRRLANGEAARQTGFRFELLSQSANAWLIAGKPMTAHEVQTEALAVRPNDVELLIDRGISLASMAKYWQAIDDLNRALDIDPDRVDALIFRASAYRRLDTLELAEEDIGRALAIAPHHPEALLERGNIRRLKGDKRGARKDWFRVVESRPDSPEAAAARLNLERMDSAPR